MGPVSSIAQKRKRPSEISLEGFVKRRRLPTLLRRKWGLAPLCEAVVTFSHYSEDLSRPRTRGRVGSLQTRKAPTSFDAEASSQKTAATYSPTGVQYHRRGRA